MKRTITFAPSGSGSINGRLVIPPTYLQLLKVTDYDRTIEMDFVDNQIIITKGDRVKKLKNVSYEVMERFILDNMEYTYNVKDVLNNEVSDLDTNCTLTLEMHGNIFFITKYAEIKNEDTEDEEIKITYDVEKIK